MNLQVNLPKKKKKLQVKNTGTEILNSFNLSKNWKQYATEQSQDVKQLIHINLSLNVSSQYQNKYSPKNNKKKKKELEKRNQNFS